MDVLDIFNFFCSGEGKGVRGPRKGVGGVGFLLKMPGGGGVSQQRGGGGAEGPGGCLRGIWGGGVNIFFRGRNAHQEKYFLRGKSAEGILLDSVNI